MYRFRTAENLLGKYKELENQEIYFASPEELNDPMEGFKDFFWQGDKIIWDNFLINYTKSLEYTFRLFTILSPDKKITENDILLCREWLPYATPFYKNLISDILELLFQNKYISKWGESMSQRNSPIRRRELLSQLQIVHPFIINSISEIYFKNGLTNKQRLFHDLSGFNKTFEKTGHFSEIVNRIEEERDNEVTEIFFSIIEQFSQSYFLNLKREDQGNENYTSSFFAIFEFPNKFLNKIESEIFPKWYSASFLSNCNNSAVWGHYGDSHKGICLKFRTLEDEGDLVLNLETEYGYSNEPLIGMFPHIFKKIQYSSKHTEIDFFRSLARLSKKELHRWWYKDSAENISECAKHFENEESEDKWRDEYWNNFTNSFSVKLKEWEYENEYRLVIHEQFNDYSNKNDRKLKYDFNDLEEIIFGIKTDISDKVKIMDIVKEKCKKYSRDDFNFYQAYYSKSTGKIEKYKVENFISK